MRYFMILILAAAVGAAVLGGCQEQQIESGEQAEVVPCPHCGEPTPVGQQCPRCGLHVENYEEIEKRP